LELRKQVDVPQMSLKTTLLIQLEHFLL